MDPTLLADPRLVFIVSVAALVSALTSSTVATRPAALRTGQVAMAFTVGQLLFLATRFSNLFYAPLMAAFVDEADRTQQLGLLHGQLLWVIVGSAVGALLGWLLLPTALELLCVGVACIDYRGSMPKALLRTLHIRAWTKAAGCLRRPSNMGVRWFRLEGISGGFFLVNVIATGIWTVGVLAALYVSGAHRDYQGTAILLSGLVTGIAAIIFSVWVDPKAAVITDQAKKGTRPTQHVTITAVHLAMGNFLGTLLAFFLLDPAIWLVTKATLALGSMGETLAGLIIPLVLLNVVFTLLASTSYCSRVSAVVTGNVATAIAIYNLFFLVTRLAGQVYAPVLGAVRDHAVRDPQMSLAELLTLFRWVLSGAAGGALLGCLLLPTFVELYNWFIRVTDERGTVPAMLRVALHPASWGSLLGCLRRPSLMGVTRADVARIPKGFLLGNVLVVAVHSCGVVAAIYAGAELSENLGRTALLLSSVVNGLATITLAIVVDPVVANLTDQCEKGHRPAADIKAAALGLVAGMLLGALLAQFILYPATQIIEYAALLLEQLMRSGL